jgi:hypothetical protein
MGPGWTLWDREKFLAPAGNRMAAVQPVAFRVTDCIPESAEDYGLKQ